MVPRPPSPSPQPRDQLARATAVATLAFLAVLVALVLASWGHWQGSSPLSGTWTAVLPDGSRRPVDVPFTMGRLGLPPESTVRVERPVSLPAAGQPQALLVTGARHHLQVRWDGQELATVGDLPGDTPIPRRERFVIPLPAGSGAEGPHRLELVIRGDHGEGGVWGELRVGDPATLHAAVAGRLAERVSLTSALVIAALLGLVIAAVRPAQREFLWFGLFCAVASGSTFAADDLWWAAQGELLPRLRIHAALHALVPGTGMMFVHHVATPTVRPWPMALVTSGLVVALFSLTWPDSTMLAAIEHITDGLSVVCVLTSLWILRRTLRSGNQSVAAIMLASGILVVAAAAERLSYELGAFDLRLLLPAFLLFLGTTTAALVLGRSDLADRYQQLVTSAQDAILVVLADGSIEESNAAAATLLGRDPVGLKLRDLVIDEEQTVVAEHRRGTGGARRVELHVQGLDGRRTTVESLATDLPERRVLLVMRDISARRKVEEGMLHAARMETVGIIAGGIAHDFNNTMTALMAHIGLLRLKVTEEKEQERLQRMEAVIRRAAHMTRRLLTMARGGEKDRRPVNPAEPVHSAVELTRSMLPRNVTIKERIDPDL
ncbi:PAS domain S-box protein, partial [Myxococcota bacterium]|nr:PAS domain S-box protein [Myxococcota bacterium]